MNQQGEITSFPQPHIRANWPSSPRGKLLTDRRIAHYQKLGYYGANGIIALQKQQTTVKLKKHKKPANELKRLLELYQ